MANFKGREGFMSAAHNFIITIPDQDLSKGAFLNIQFDQSSVNPDRVKSGQTQAFSNPHLNKVQSSLRWYGPEAIKTLTEAAGDKSFIHDREITRQDGTKDVKHDRVIGVSAHIKQLKATIKRQDGTTYKGDDLILLTKSAPVEQSTNKFFPSKGEADDPAKMTKGANLLARQAAVTAAAKEYEAAQKQPVNLEKAQAQADATIASVEPQADGPQATQPTLDEAAEF